MSVDTSPLRGLVAVVQYRRKDFGSWSTMAAFDVRSIADEYAADLTKDSSRPWEYRVVDIDPDTFEARTTPTPNQHHPSPSASAGGDGEEHQS